MRALLSAAVKLAVLPAVSLTLAGCAANNVAAHTVCDAGPSIQVEGFPAAAVLPAGAIIDSQSSGFPPEFASDNYQVVAYAAADIETIRRFYRCALPELGYPVIGEEQGNVWLLRFGGPAVDDGSVLVGDGRTEGEVAIQIFMIEKED